MNPFKSRLVFYANRFHTFRSVFLFLYYDFVVDDAIHHRLSRETLRRLLLDEFNGLMHGPPTAGPG